jgi:transcriptional regulator with XRE-family HTH domain
MTSAGSVSPFGRELRRWRQVRGLSQLRLATEAEMSPRHLSFVETGRSRPSQGVVLRLADALEVPLRERNRMLIAAGLAPVYPERPLEDAELAPFRRIVSTLLSKQEPYPAFAFDRAYRLVDANRVGRSFYPDLEHVDWVDATFAPGSPVRASIENFDELAWTVLELMRRDLDGGPEALADAARRLERHLADVPRPAVDHGVGRSPAVISRFRFGERRVQTVTTILRFDIARDVTLDELRVELVFPTDPDSARFFEELFASV